jgi:hypothetical protein
MPEVSDSLGYAMGMEKHSSKKLDRVKELLTEKFNYLKDTVENNKRQTVYFAVTLGSGIAGYALTGHPLMGTSCAVVAGSTSMIHNEFKEIEEERIAREEQRS